MMNKSNTQRNPARFLFWGAALLLVLWLGLKGWRIGRAIQSLQARPAEAETLLVNGLTNWDPNAVEALILGIRRDVVTLKVETAVFLPLAPYLAWLPQVGPTIVAAPQLVAMADAGTETAVYAIRGFKPAFALLQENQSGVELVTSLMPVIEQARPEIASMSLALNKIAAARSEIEDPEALHPRIRPLIAQMDAWLPPAQDGLKLLPYLPQMMGMDGPRRYLIIAQNEDELRPTGGFISGAGLLVVENGRIADLTFLDANLVDNWQELPYDFPPQPLYDHMLLELFLFRDANFWPDFPTSAEKAMELYSYGQNVPTPDGAIAVDQRFLQLLVEATGPIHIPDAESLISDENVIANLQAAWALQEDQEIKDWSLNRKDFIATFAAAIQDKIETDFANVNPSLLISNILQAIETKHLQIYLRDPEAAVILHELHWDGRLPMNPSHDFLMIVDTNMGYTKANPVIAQSLAYQIQLQNDGAAKANLTVNYQHAGVDNGEPCRQGTVYNLEIAVDYQTLVNACYWTYLRLYVPPDSALIESSRHFISSDALLSEDPWHGLTQATNDLAGLTTFSNFIMVPRGEQVSSHFAYRLPDPVVQTDTEGSLYQLAVYKQAGTPARPMDILVTLPVGAEFVEADPEPAAVEANTVRFVFDLETDTIISVRYR